MTNPQEDITNPIEPHYKVRVVLPGVVLHLASLTEPELVHQTNGLIELTDVPDDVKADWISGPGYGDTIGFIRWDLVTAITWRWHE